MFRRIWIECPPIPASLRLTLDNEVLAGDRNVIAWASARDLARPHLEGDGLAVDAGLAEADDGVRAPRGVPHRDRIAARRRVEGIDPERAQRRVRRPASIVISGARSKPARDHWLRSALGRRDQRRPPRGGLPAAD